MVRRPSSSIVATAARTGATNTRASTSRVPKSTKGATLKQEGRGEAKQKEGRTGRGSAKQNEGRTGRSEAKQNEGKTGRGSAMQKEGRKGRGSAKQKEGKTGRGSAKLIGGRKSRNTSAERQERANDILEQLRAEVWGWKFKFEEFFEYYNRDVKKMLKEIKRIKNMLQIATLNQERTASR